jgi:hypothetical protein
MAMDTQPSLISAGVAFYAMRWRSSLRLPLWIAPGCLFRSGAHRRADHPSAAVYPETPACSRQVTNLINANDSTLAAPRCLWQHSGPAARVSRR